ncbi:serine/threonine-protein kinase [Derxia gummosa]|uniref:non-specific serine/threonine protein kinase n=1 Tax=Derxia gummosa DSM 723 TaxID=1121388 RepID=A0A8B6XAP0_9BURK|nr:serine/threonine-protein kinase [Derxia gummosa]
MNAASGAIPLPDVMTIGRFRIERALGVGSMGTVYLAHDPVLHRALAIKTLSVHLAPAEARVFEDSLLNEARAVARLNHPHIITVYDAGRSDGVPYIAMERLDGQELKQRLQRDTPMPLREFLELFTRVADALDYAHRHGIVHRDIKPANIFLTTKSGPKVLDFGIAQAASLGQPVAQRGRGALVGTPNYMSPELIQGRPLDGRSDVFSLGVVMYEVLTGRLPFSGRTLDELTQNIVGAPIAPPQTLNPEVPIEIAAIVSRALARQPEQRYPDARALASDLRHQLERLDVQRLVNRIGAALPDSVVRTPTRRRSLALATALMVAAGVALWQSGRESSSGATTATPPQTGATAGARQPIPAPAPATSPPSEPGSTDGTAAVHAGRDGAPPAPTATAAPVTTAAGADPAPRPPEPATGAALPATAGAQANPQAAPSAPPPSSLPAGPVVGAAPTPNTAATPASAAPRALPPPSVPSVTGLAPDALPPTSAAGTRDPPRVVAGLPAEPAKAPSASRAARSAPAPVRPAVRDLPAPAPAVIAGTLEVAVSPWGEVFINGQSRGLTPPLSSLKLAPGSYSIEIRNGDFPTYRTSADIQSNGTTRIRHKF